MDYSPSVDAVMYADPYNKESFLNAQTEYYLAEGWGTAAAFEQADVDWENEQEHQAEMQQGEIDAEMAVERYYENRGYDTDGIYR